jgi:hypothetical protein
MAQGEFSVYQFFEDGSQERVRQFVDVQEATDAFAHYTNNVACRIGITKRVIITDGGDSTVAEWQHGKGLVWPNKDDKEPNNG